MSESKAAQLLSESVSMSLAFYRNKVPIPLNPRGSLAFYGQFTDDCRHALLGWDLFRILSLCNSSTMNITDCLLNRFKKDNAASEK
ncbi:hypothetical protein DAPPUDRAFT_243842 [Daphnia pulex]|uniref:Uncharacterized protein n=1 Tax=Daphnia pulex TaxID=6669 RepID=E9GJM7_DAPPU|nr:hypothetical protein DAPPUDRAFT_243842 [Daphnia pulex]|eukprot:EFX80137.1 hypothetical protein DAPPUDRAFT_243842 [Daphnia pulex]